MRSKSVRGLVAALSCASGWLCAAGCGSRTELWQTPETSNAPAAPSSTSVVKSGPPQPSCAPMDAATSSCGVASDSCCTSVEVPGGTFYRTYTNTGGGPTGEADPATVSGFSLDKYEVTVGRFRQFVDAWKAGYLPPVGSGKHVHLNGGRGLANTSVPGTYEPGWIATDDANIDPTDFTLSCPPLGASWTSSPGANETQPISCVTWAEAYAFCIWDGEFLPSQAEWEFAAAGGGDASGQREYPWGSTDPGTENQYAIYGCLYDQSCSTLAPVGGRPLGAGRWGHLDLAGNVDEYALDWLVDQLSNPSVDGAATTVVTPCWCDVRTSGGGAALERAALLSPALRGGESAPRMDYTGFRCAAPP
jgi:sulfatase modifying factor 1